MHSELSSQDLQTRLMPAVHGETSYSKGPQGVHSEQIVSEESAHPPSTKYGVWHDRQGKHPISECVSHSDTLYWPAGHSVEHAAHMTSILSVHGVCTYVPLLQSQTGSLSFNPVLPSDGFPKWSRTNPAPRVTYKSDRCEISNAFSTSQAGCVQTNVVFASVVLVAFVMILMRQTSSALHRSFKSKTTRRLAFLPRRPPPTTGTKASSGSPNPSSSTIETRRGIASSTTTGSSNSNTRSSPAKFALNSEGPVTSFVKSLAFTGLPPSKSAVLTLTSGKDAMS
mmetsp:Transcript_27039/g.70045  ORF Transcript_27039/g.70045 Transcript_27039/m.70045 type:complete len:282 (+) Transcript_27039:237-1082(+)